jgi:hypothetical protein
MDVHYSCLVLYFEVYLKYLPYINIVFTTGLKRLCDEFPKGLRRILAVSNPEITRYNTIINITLT